jgi:hypothetical protein
MSSFRNSAGARLHRMKTKEKSRKEKEEKFRNNLIKGQNLTKEMEKSMILMIGILNR